MLPGSFVWVGHASIEVLLDDARQWPQAVAHGLQDDAVDDLQQEAVARCVDQQ